MPQLGTADGWRKEGYDGGNGWAVAALDGNDADGEAAERVSELLESEVVPRFYDRQQAEAAPAAWTTMMKHAIRRAGGQFTARRMLTEYVEGCYAPGLSDATVRDAPPTG